jgi:hypothetical protein
MGMMQPDKNYEKVRLKLKVYCQAEADAVLTGAVGGDKAQVFDAASLAPAELRKTFDRSKIEEEYTAALSGNTLNRGVNNRLRNQNEVLATLEKTCRMRHRRRLDYLVSGVSRSRALASDTGYVNHVLGELVYIGAL